MPVIHRYPTGKVPADALQRIVFSRLGVPSGRLLQGPGVGEDAAVLDMGDRVLVVATDPITGAVGSVGWLAVHVNANDIASCGARPLWFLCVTLLPEGAGDGVLEEIMGQMHDACREVGVSIVGGHTETTPGLDRPILVGFMMGEVPRDGYVTTGGARPGDALIMTKGAGIEGTAILAVDLAPVLRGRVGEEALRRAESMLERISVVPEAMRAVEVGGVHSLHDPTEGGLLNGVWEMAEAAGVGVAVREEAIPVAAETRLICDALGIDPLKLLGSGSLLIAAEAGKADEIVSALRGIGVEASIIGEVKAGDEKRVLIKRDGRRVAIEMVEQDHLYKILDEYGMDVDGPA
ncbi:hypothetical protein AC482_05000 [miscellaneous Crenarchaeota group-15 archaeon DG-45]|uniref:Hydrogenase n=1 Tax=miscellaneous Crenarchaeota group-15 archaeon DG-45 TaxID=1685127 RepID=A0A0M0BN61_9ARCH|nr:MAG: hypothetical protein AC482_05000 [miscellaneous Crenarchaeota group-15 archaeon DG-45]